MGNVRSSITIGHDGSSQSHDHATEFGKRYLQNFWIEARSHFAEEYDYDIEVERTNSGTVVSALFSDWAGTRNVSSEFAAHLFDYFLFERRGEIGATLALHGATLEREFDAEYTSADGRTRSHPVFLKTDNGWGLKDDDQLLLDDGQAIALPDGPARCECWGCNTIFETDTRLSAAEAIVNARADALDEIAALYFEWAIPTQTDRHPTLQEYRTAALKKAFGKKRTTDIFSLFNTQFNLVPEVVASSVDELFRAAPRADLPDVLTLWMRCIDHSEARVRDTAFSSSVRFLTPFAHSLDLSRPVPRCAGDDWTRRFRNACESGTAATSEEIAAAGVILLETTPKKARSDIAGVFSLFRRHEDQRYRNAEAQWQEHDLDLKDLVDEIEVKRIGGAADYKSPSGKLAAAYELLSRLISEVESRDAKFRKTDAYKAIKRLKGEALADVVVAAYELERTLLNLIGSDGTPEDLLNRHRSELLISFRDAISKPKGTTVQPDQLKAILRTLPVEPMTWSVAFLELAERCKSNHRLDSDTLSLIEPFADKKMFYEAEIRGRIAALLEVAPPAQLKIPGIRRNEAPWSDKALEHVGQQPDAQEWVTWLTHVSKWKGKSGSASWKEKNWAHVTNIGEQRVVEAIDQWFEEGRGSYENDDNLKAATGLVWTLCDSRSERADAVLSNAFRVLDLPAGAASQNVLASKLLERGTFAAYDAYLENRDWLHSPNRDSQALKRLEKKTDFWDRAFAALRAAADSRTLSEAALETKLTAWTIAKMSTMQPSYSDDSERNDALEAHLANLPIELNDSLRSSHAETLVIELSDRYSDGAWDSAHAMLVKHAPDFDRERFIALTVVEQNAEVAVQRLSKVNLVGRLPSAMSIEFESNTVDYFSGSTAGFRRIVRDLSSALVENDRGEIALELLRTALKFVDHADFHFLIACIHSTNGEVDAGLSAIARAVELDADRKRKAMRDPRLESLRADPRFVEMVEPS